MSRRLAKFIVHKTNFFNYLGICGVDHSTVLRYQLQLCENVNAVLDSTKRFNVASLADMINRIVVKPKRCELASCSLAITILHIR
jgi:hypothetical protein